MNSLQIISSRLRYFAPVWVFASLNIITGTWVLYLPYIKSKFELDDGQIGRALFCTALGSLLAITVVPYVNKKIGVGKSTIWGIVLFATLFNFPLLASNYYFLCLSLFLVGIFSGFTDVSMNALVSNIETKDEIPFMSAAHGFFSLGGFIGAVIGSGLMLFLSVPVNHMLLISGIIILSNLFLCRQYVHITESPSQEKKQSFSFKHIRSFIGLSIIAFIIMFNEGAVEHWSNIYLHDTIDIAEQQAGIGFISFSLCMTIGRFFGDHLSAKFGAIYMIKFGCLLALMAYGCIVSTSIIPVILGFGLLGLGLSVIIPEIFRLAGQSKRVSPSVGISIVSGVGFLGFLIGPILIGTLSNNFGLVSSFLFLGILVALSLLIMYTKIGED